VRTRPTARIGGRPTRERTADVRRTTKETDVRVRLAIDGSGTYSVETGVPFLDHMIELFARHGFFDLTWRQRRPQVDAHHTVEDVGLTLGRPSEMH